MLALQSRVLVPKPLTVVGFVQVSPVGVDEDTWKLTAPVKPPAVETVIVDVPVAPARIVEGETDPAETEKSGAAAKLKVMVAVVCDSVPLLPVTVTSKVPVVPEWQERLVCSTPGMVTGSTELQVRPPAGESVNDTVPVKPFVGAIVTGVEQLFGKTH